ncbi:uncharacterized protein LOC21387514 isoform X1 [Morus notabilis]|uniref:uncharacterized protein LOC21387514 isoform X1 n=1 Tax=Morus notabilis TaxID=981085 RepID=UPI000CED4408|nr:uncharacterized protein LOC21387514 isoform X1 [Morus notabilis]
MNISTSKFSSGCESGWTLYLDQSYISESEFQRDNSDNNNNNYNYNGIAECGGKGVREEEEEDLSMVSDASSGPPHYHEDCYCENGSSFSASNWAYNNNDNKSSKDREKKKMMMKEKCTNEYHSCIDDTASSPVSKKKSTLPRNGAFMENNRLDYSQGFSATHFEGESAFGNHFGMFQSSLAKGSAPQKPDDFQGGNWN